MWQKIREALERLWTQSRSGANERRVARERARFWSELREGESDSERAARAREGGVDR